MQQTHPINRGDSTFSGSLLDTLHPPQPSTHVQPHLKIGQYLKSTLYGGLDGLVNTLSVIVGGYGSNTSTFHVMSVGVAVMIGDGIGMGLGDYLSSKAENEFVKAQQARETWEVENKLDDEKKEMEDLYVEKGYGEEEARKVTELISRSKQAFVNIMMAEELGLSVSESSPAINGLVTFISFVLFGFPPLIPYIISNFFLSIAPFDMLMIGLGIGTFLFFALGFAKAMLLKTNRLFSGVQSLVLGAAAVAVGYAVGLALGASSSSSSSSE